MNEIIKNIQDHDQSMFAMEHKLISTLEDNKKKLGDDSFEKPLKKHPDSSSESGGETA